MKFVLDSCILINLVKTNTFEQLKNLVDEIVIDSHVFEEVVTNGKLYGYKDAFEADLLIKKYKIQIINVDISNDIKFLKDPGETSTFLLINNSVGLTSDIGVFKKISRRKENILMIVAFIIACFHLKKITREKLIDWLDYYIT
jgi:hypothetical protein